MSGNDNAQNQVRVDITASTEDLKKELDEAQVRLHLLANAGAAATQTMGGLAVKEKNMAVLTAEIKRLEAAMNPLAPSAAEYAKSIDKVGAATSRFGQIFSAAALVYAANRAVGAVVGVIRSAITAQDEMLKMSQAAGMTTESLSGLGYAAEQSGSSVNALVAASKTLSREIVEASRAADQGATVFGSMGISVRDASGALRSTDQILLDVADKFSRMGDGANKSALAVKLLGRSRVELIPFLNNGRDGLRELIAEAERLGVVVNTDAARMSEQFNDNMTKIGKAVEGVGRQIGNSALPMLSLLVDQLAGAAAGSNSLGRDLRDMFSRANIEAWAENGAYAVAILVDGFRYAAAGAQSVGIAVAGVGLAIAQARDGSFAEAKDTLAAIPALIGDAFSFEQLAPKVTAFFSELRAKAGQEQKKTNDTLKKGASDYVEFDESALKKQAALREKYGEEEKLRALGEFQYKKELIEKKYAADLAAVNGARDQASLEVAIRQRMHDEIIALERSMAAAAVSGNAEALSSASASAASRVAVERTAAGQVVALWSQANAAKAATTGGQIMNAGTPGEFVSSWDANNNYVGDLGSTSSGFATGGSFMVGGSGGTDSRMIAFRASPDERVTIETPEQQRAGGGITIENLNLPGVRNAREFVAELRQMLRTNPDLLSPGFARAG